MQASKRASRRTQSHFACEPAMPMARAPLRRAICPTMQPTGPEAAETSTVSPARSCATSSRPKYAVMPGTPRMPSAVDAGTCPGCSRHASAPSKTAVVRSPVSQPDPVADVEYVVARLDHLGDGLRRHHVARLRHAQEMPARQQGAYVGVQRQPLRADADLSGGEFLARRRVDEFEILGTRQPLGHAADDHLRVAHGRVRTWRR